MRARWTVSVNGQPVTGWRKGAAIAVLAVAYYVGVLLHPLLRLFGRRGCIWHVLPDERGRHLMVSVSAESFQKWPDERAPERSKT